jgi:nucleoside-diphosphate-sugar epimerase
MRVLITGASGFLGCRVLNLLMQQNVDTVIVGRTRPPGVPLEKFLPCDLLATSDFKSLVNLANATHLLHLAWFTEHGEYWKSPLNLRWIDATVRITEAFCLAGGKKIVMAGTCAEYDWSYGFCSEDYTPLQPNTLYGEAKDVTRRLMAAICEENQIEWSWGRIFLTYGPGEDSRRLIPSLIDVFNGKRAPFGVNSSAYRDFLHIDDVAAGFIALLKNDSVGVFNICSAQPLAITEVVKKLAKKQNANPNLVLKLSSSRLDEPAFIVGKNTKLLRIGWYPTHNFFNA